MCARGCGIAIGANAIGQRSDQRSDHLIGTDRVVLLGDDGVDGIMMMRG